MTNKRKGELSIWTAALLYGSFGVFSKLISFQLPVFYQSFVRNVFAILIIGSLMFFFKKWKKVLRKDIKWFSLRSVFGFISFIGIYFAFTKLDIATTYFLTYAASAVVGYLLGVFIFKERLTKQTIISLILALSGLFFIYKVNINIKTFPYIILALISGFAGPGWNVFSKKISSSYSNLQLNFIDSIFAAALPLFVSIFIHETWVPVVFNQIWIVTFLFGLMFIINGLLIVYGFSKIKAQEGIIILLFEIISGVIFGYLFFKTIPSLGSIIGGCFIISSIFIQSYFSKHEI